MRREVVIAVAMTATTIVVVGALLHRWQKRKERRWQQTQSIIRKLARECATPVPKLWEVADALVLGMQNSLATRESKTTLDMIVSHDHSLPTGEEQGLYYGVNLGETSFLILCTRLRGNNESLSDVHKEEIHFPSHYQGASPKDVLDYVALMVANFMSAHPDNKAIEPKHGRRLGFTISYQLHQASYPGISPHWKTFRTDEAVHKELLEYINSSLKKYKADLEVFALAVDPVGDLAGGRYYNKDCKAAVTLGMETNAAYVESPQAIPKLEGKSSNSVEMVISIDWGSFKTPLFPSTEFDTSTDAESIYRRGQVEKFRNLISGKHLGEIVRRVLVRMAYQTSLFGRTIPRELLIPYILSAPDMAAMHQDTSEDRKVVKQKVQDVFKITETTPMVREVVAEVCDIVVERGARLAAAGIVAIVKKLGRIETKRTVVTVEGGLYEHYRVYRNYIHSAVWEMLGSEHSDNIIVEHSHGGSGSGAIFLAAAQEGNPSTS